MARVTPARVNLPAMALEAPDWKMASFATRIESSTGNRSGIAADRSVGASAPAQIPAETVPIRTRRWGPLGPFSQLRVAFDTVPPSEREAGGRRPTSFLAISLHSFSAAGTTGADRSGALERVGIANRDYGLSVVTGSDRREDGFAVSITRRDGAWRPAALRHGRYRTVRQDSGRRNAMNGRQEHPVDAAAALPSDDRSASGRRRESGRNAPIRARRVGAGGAA